VVLPTWTYRLGGNTSASRARAGRRAHIRLRPAPQPKLDDPPMPLVPYASAPPRTVSDAHAEHACFDDRAEDLFADAGLGAPRAISMLEALRGGCATFFVNVPELSKQTFNNHREKIR
jgi:hypothetical protein